MLSAICPRASATLRTIGHFHCLSSACGYVALIGDPNSPSHHVVPGRSRFFVRYSHISRNLIKGFRIRDTWRLVNSLIFSFNQEWYYDSSRSIGFILPLHPPPSNKPPNLPRVIWQPQQILCWNRHLMFLLIENKINGLHKKYQYWKTNIIF